MSPQIETEGHAAVITTNKTQWCPRALCAGKWQKTHRAPASSLQKAGNMLVLIICEPVCEDTLSSVVCADVPSSHPSPALHSTMKWSETRFLAMQRVSREHSESSVAVPKVMDSSYCLIWAFKCFILTEKGSGKTQPRPGSPAPSFPGETVPLAARVPQGSTGRLWPA